MNKKLFFILILSMLFSVLSGCDKKSSAPAAGSSENKTTSTENEETKAALDECLKLIGKTDKDSASMLGGGKENKSADGSTLIGRIYHSKIFGEEVEIGTLYDDKNEVGTVVMNLSNEDASVYAEQLEKIYGKPSEVNDKPSESGSTWKSWNIDGLQVRLYQAYKLSSLEITKLK